MSDCDWVQDDTAVVKAAPARPAPVAAVSSSSTEPRPTVAAIYSSSGDAMPHQYAGDATHTTEIDTALDK